MTIRTRRRGRRSLAAIVAAVLLASLLAVVAGSPAQAANTSSEALVDTNADGVPDAREFGGRDRYDTALRLAENFAAGKGGLGQVPVAFIASGYTLVDAVAVSGLAGFQDAPVLLTPMDNLHGGVADFIEDYGVDTIYVLGGSAAVADSVLEDMEALANAPTVTRIAGADRYATASAIASKLGGGAAWCGGEDAAAILVNGGDSSLAEAMMVGPVAHRLQLPVLMTAADELPSATADFIRADDIEHVIIVGGTDAVSEGVEGALTDAGVNTVERIAGNTPAGTSVALAGLLAGDCKDDLAPVSGDTVALVHRDALPDGVAAAPVLSSTFANGDLVPILVVGDTLPASVRDYLAATPVTDSDGDKVNFRLVAIGGTAAVSSAVMDAALAAAASNDALSVKIAAEGGDLDQDGDPTNDPPQAGNTKVVLHFSDNVAGIGSDVAAQLADLTNKIRDILAVNGVPARLAATDPVAHGTGTDAVCDPDTLTVELASSLRAGDTVSVNASNLKFGAAEDLRTISATSVTVPAPPVDRTRPTVSAIGIVGQATFLVSITEDNPPDTVQLTAEDFELNSSLGNTLGDVTWTAGETSGTVAVEDTASTPSDLIKAGDRLTIKSGAVEDTNNNKSLQRSFSAVAPQKSPRVTSVLMSNLKHERQVSVTVPTAFTADGNDITISAKKDGAAAGAAGNAWSFVFDVASTYDAEKATDIDVRVNSGDRIVFVRFVNGAAKYADLKAALEGNSAFDAMFEVGLPPDADGGCGATANLDLTIGTASREIAADAATGDETGRTQVAIEVRFNSYIQSLAGDGVNLLDRVLAATLARAQSVEATADATSVRTALGMATIADVTTFSAPGTMVRYEAITENAAMLPAVRDLVNIAAGSEDDTNTAANEAQDPVATGYAANDTGTIVNENENGRSQVRIGRSSGVKVPADPSSS